MYTYDSFETLGVFTLLRPMYITVLVMSLLLFFIIIIPKFYTRWLNGFAIISLTSVLIFVSCQLLYYSGIIVDEIGLGGDPVSFYLFLAITIMGAINIIIYFLKCGKSTK
ncbi:hypothetical protein [Alkalihalobacterium chitinilyticum]|uniref:Uncharacterized protein n=1 Tax=Alkalihalobacterium chitinilyticum TaxID=2980103 RepID=A0ABT5VL57_9BACI|nr:hypothetical protein [Alkalihalobacterium chitinilyticum]MDE5416178.1 hypothetical protein [Alkalihalobacterium chitinilyticum]